MDITFKLFNIDSTNEGFFFSDNTYPDYLVIGTNKYST